MLAFLKRNRSQMASELVQSGHWEDFSAAVYCQYRITVPIAHAHCRGELLDVGAGDLRYRKMLEDRVTTYHSVDIEKRSEDVDFVADAQNMQGVIPSERYDTVLLFEVLEHVPNPMQVAKELFRVLRPGGKVVLSVPHLSRLHEEPYDFYRYTRYGLEHIFREAGFKQMEIHTRGGLFCFLGHQVSTTAVCLAWNIPVVKQLVLSLNKWLVTKLSFSLDKLTRNERLFPLGYVAVAQK